ncbi:hypothetical protein GCM10009535_45060 [Streptomyces thermocarboxydovorans]|uniref:Uncharacterized protein n=1 Tax=Streptomyces thermocarboxydovorans TaxID=59298 RepID=A0ABN1HNY5_9ACTN
MSLPSYKGPLLPLTGGVDCSFVLSALTGGLTYLLTTSSRPATPRPTEPVPADQLVS